MAQRRGRIPLFLLADRRAMRVLTLVAVFAAWSALTVGVVADVGWLAGCGGIAAGLLAMVHVKATFEVRGRIRARLQDLEEGDAALGQRVDDLQASQRTRFQEMERALATHDGVADVTTGAVAANRRLLDKVARRVIEDRISPELADLECVPSGDPLLSLAVPSFNRPEKLSECLASIEREVATTDGGEVELWITDDASTDPDTIEIAGDFVRRTDFAALRLNANNLGLERNLVEACRPCRGEYVLVLGNDDRLRPGALRTILSDCRTRDAGVLLFEKERISIEGDLVDRIPGSSPVDLAPGEARRFDTALEAVRLQGLISTFGFISTVVFRRQPFEELAVERYLGLTMFPLAFAIIEALGGELLVYRNVAVVDHRTQTPTQKAAEAMGRDEESFMQGGRAKGTRYSGTALAASFQRLVDRGAIDYDAIMSMPERLQTKMSLVEWMAYWRAQDSMVDASLPADVVADADRLFAAIGES